jgi:hypothetical protein
MYLSHRFHLRSNICAHITTLSNVINCYFLDFQLNYTIVKTTSYLYFCRD